MFLIKWPVIGSIRLVFLIKWPISESTRQVFLIKWPVSVDFLFTVILHIYVNLPHIRIGLIISPVKLHWMSVDAHFLQITRIL